MAPWGHQISTALLFDQGKKVSIKEELYVHIERSGAVCSQQNMCAPHSMETHLLKRTGSRTQGAACSKGCPAMPLSPLTVLLTLQLQQPQPGCDWIELQDQERRCLFPALQQLRVVNCTGSTQGGALKPF